MDVEALSSGGGEFRISAPSLPRGALRDSVGSGLCEDVEVETSYRFIWALVKSKLLIPRNRSPSVFDPQDGNDLFVHHQSLYEIARPGV